MIKMSNIGNKIKEVFGSAAVYKNPANYEVFNGRNLPSFVKDYLISTHIAADGTFKREALSQFLDADALFAASIISRSSKRLSIGGNVDWTMNTVVPRTDSLNAGWNSPSLKSVTIDSPNPIPRDFEIFSAK